VNDVLKELISRYLEEPDNIEVTKRIKKLRAVESDFSDELFESFGAESRRQIYAALLLWTDLTNTKRILDRRASSEVDWPCNERLQFMISNWPP
jgi:hypothetical protein